MTRRILFRVLQWWCFGCGLLFAVWCCGVAFFLFGWSGQLQIAGTLLLGVGLLAGLIAGFFYRFFFYAVFLMEAGILGFYCSITPERQFANVEFQRPWARKPAVSRQGNRIRVKNIRNFHYRTEQDFDMNYIEGLYDISKLCSLDIALSHWDNLEKIAHTMLSFGFSDGRYLVLSMETRLPLGATQGFIPGIYKQYEAIAVLGTEEDLFKLRTNFRGEILYLYRTNATAEQLRTLFEIVIADVETMEKKPRFYNSLTANCTTLLTPLLAAVNPASTRDIRLLLNGESDLLLFELGYLQCLPDEQFSDLKERSQTNQYINKNDNYSQMIRKGQK